MTYYVHFGDTYDGYQQLKLPLEDMLMVEADGPEAAVEQLLQAGKRPTDRRLRCVTVISAVNGKRDRGSQFWINFDGEPKHLQEMIYCP